jgi:hypothetical protein
MGEAALSAVEAAADLASESGLPDEMATTQAAEAAIAAASYFGEESAAQVKDVLYEKYPHLKDDTKS